MVETFARILDVKVQERAFGAPGVAGDPDRIVHMSKRFIAVYRDLLEWAAELRGVSRPAYCDELYEVLAEAAKQPISSIRDFVFHYVADLDPLTKFLKDPGEPVRINRTISFVVPRDYHERYASAFKKATKGR
jgi:hypothetical protein